MPMAVTTQPEYEALAVRPREAAKRLGISERTLWNWSKDGLVPHLKVGRAVLYPVAALERWLAERAGNPAQG